MVTEFRRLVFSTSELEVAIKTFNKEKALKLPEGEILGIKIVGEPNVSARVQVGDIYGSTEEQEVVLEAGYLAAAMLYHCGKNNIPIPKAPKKILEHVGDGLALSFSINADSQSVDVPSSSD